MKLTFKNKHEFAKAIIEKPMWNSKGQKVYFDINHMSPFRFLNHGMSEYESDYIFKLWKTFNDEWETKEPLNHLDFIEFWDNSNTHVRNIGFWDARNNCPFDKLGSLGADWDNYEKIQGECPEWAKEAVKTLPKE
jgi:hypothetical protein